MALHRDDVDRLLDPELTAELSAVTLEELRRRRDACQRAETALSYVRRVIQGELDLVAAELAARSNGVRGDASRLIDDLPSILSGPPDAAGGSALPSDDRRRTARSTILGSAEGWTDTTELDLEALVAEVLSHEALPGAEGPVPLPGANLGALSDDELDAIARWLRAGETSVSANRRALHDRIDLLQAAVVERYKVGLASADTLLS